MPGGRVPGRVGKVLGRSGRFPGRVGLVEGRSPAPGRVGRLPASGRSPAPGRMGLVEGRSPAPGRPGTGRVEGRFCRKSPAAPPGRVLGRLPGRFESHGFLKSFPEGLPAGLPGKLPGRLLLGRVVPLPGRGLAGRPGIPVEGRPVAGLPVLGLPVFGLPVLGLPVLGLPEFGLPVLGLLPAGRDGRLAGRLIDGDLPAEGRLRFTLPPPRFIPPPPRPRWAKVSSHSQMLISTNPAKQSRDFALIGYSFFILLARCEFLFSLDDDFIDAGQKFAIQHSIDFLPAEVAILQGTENAGVGSFRTIDEGG